MNKPTPELRAEWARKLADSGFDDLEAPPPPRTNGDPKRHAAYHCDYIRSDNPSHDRPLPLHRVVEAEARDDIPPKYRVDHIDLWESPVPKPPAPDLTPALTGFAFKDEIDFEIFARFYVGDTRRSITRRLKVGTPRFLRVLREVRDWYRDEIEPCPPPAGK